MFVLPPGKHFRRSSLFFNNFTVEPFSGYLYRRLEFYYRCLAVSTAIRRGQLERARIVLALAFATGPGRRPFQASMRAMDIIKMLELDELWLQIGRRAGLNLPWNHGIVFLVRYE